MRLRQAMKVVRNYRRHNYRGTTWSTALRCYRRASKLEKGWVKFQAWWARRTGRVSYS